MKVLFWNVDTQKDFMLPDGKLYVKDAEKIIPNLEKLTKLARTFNLRVVNTGDYHCSADREISDKPDFKTTFPPHCMAATDGVDFISATEPRSDFVRGYFILNPEAKKIDFSGLNRKQDVIIHKDEFDVFEGNPHTNSLVCWLDPDVVFVYGVATNVCVHYAVMGLVSRGIGVVVVNDAIKELPGLPLEPILSQWHKEAVVQFTTEQTEVFIGALKDIRQLENYPIIIKKRLWLDNWY